MSQTLFSNRLRSLSLAGAAVFTVAMFAATANAALLVYDPFGISGGAGDYLVGDDSTNTNVLGGQNPVASPTAFYAGPWLQAGGDAQAVRAPGGPLGPSVMNYPKFPRSGGLVTDAVQFNCCSFGRNGRPLTNILGGGRDPLTIYNSFLVDFGSQGTDDPTQFGKRGVEYWNGYDGNSPDGELTTQVFVNHFSGVTDLSLQTVSPGSGTQTVALAGNLDLVDLAGVHLVVVKFEFDPALPDVVTVYLDPTDSIESNWTPAASLSVATSDLVISHQGTAGHFTFSGGGHHPSKYDEVRWGDTFADVTPFVPEPTSLCLMGISMAGLLLGRRR